MKTILLLTTIVTLTLPTLFSQPATAQPRSTVLTPGTMLAKAKLTVEQLIERAESKVTAQDYQGAIADYKKALELNTKNPEPYSRMAYIYVIQANHGEAVKAFSQYLKMADAESISQKDYADRGLSYHAIGDYQNAISDFNQSIKIEPLYGSGYYYRGLTYQALGQKQEALADFKRVLEVDREHPEAEEIMKTIKELQ